MNHRLFTLIFLLAVNFQLAAFELSGEIYLRTDYLTDVQEAESINQDNSDYFESYRLHSKLIVQDSLFLPIKSLPDQISFDWEVAAIVNQPAEESYFDIRRALINYAINEKFSLAAGVAFETWGRTDELNPVDFAYAQNRTRFYSEKKNPRKISREQISFSYSNDDTLFNLTWFPNASRNQLPEIESIWCDGFCQASHIDVQADWFRANQMNVLVAKPKSDQQELAIRYTSRYQDFDYGLSYFNGNDHWTRISRRWYGNDAVILQETTPTSEMFGFDFAYSFSSFALRFETALYQDAFFYWRPNQAEYFLDDDGLDQRNALSSIFSIDFNGFGNTYFNLQYLTTRIEKSEQIVRPSEINLTTLLVSRNWENPELKLEYTASYDRDNDSSFSQLALSWQLTYQQNLMIALQHFDGNEGSGYGHFDNNDSIYFSTQYLF